MRLKLQQAVTIPKATFRQLEQGALFKLDPAENQIKGIKPEAAFLIKLARPTVLDGENALLTQSGGFFHIADDASVHEYAVTAVEAL